MYLDKLHGEYSGTACACANMWIPGAHLRFFKHLEMKQWQWGREAFIIHYKGYSVQNLESVQDCTLDGNLDCA